MSDQKQDPVSLWEKWEVEFQMRDRLYGGIPKNPDVMSSWIKVGTGLSDSVLDEAVERIKATDPTAVTVANIDQIAEKGWTGFKSDTNGLFVEHRQVKAMLKEAANILRDVLGIKAFRSKIAELIFLEGDTQFGEGRIHLDRLTPDGFEERPVHAMTPSGPITALKRVDYVDTPTIQFTLKILHKPVLDQDKKKWWAKDFLPVLFEYASENGFGADRSQEKGKFRLTRLEKTA